MNQHLIEQVVVSLPIDFKEQIKRDFILSATGSKYKSKHKDVGTAAVQWYLMGIINTYENIGQIESAQEIQEAFGECFEDSWVADSSWIPDD